MENLSQITKKLKNININENKNILNEFEYLFIKNASNIKEILKKENDLLGANYQYDKLLKSFETLKNYEFDKLKGYSSIGRIACLTNGDVYFVLELIIKAILTKSKIVFATESYMLNTNTYLIELAQNALEKYNVSAYAVSICNVSDYKEIVRCVENIDCIIVNKNFDLYKQMHELTDIKIIYSDYGNINVYSESEDFNDEIKILCDSAKREDKDVFLAKTQDIQSYIDNMSNNFVFYSVVIYTKNLEKCAYFLKNIKAENVYINKNPFEFNDAEFPEFEILFKKKIIY